MHPDYFATLNQPRRPWLDLELLKKNYQRLTFEQHPDRTDGDTQSDFAEITEAYRVLGNPKLRLQHLLSLEASVPQLSEVPSEIADVFMNTASLVRQLDQFVQRRDAAGTALAKSMLRTEGGTIQKQVGLALDNLNGLYEIALTELKRLDELWMNDRTGAAPELAKLAQRFGYLERWIGQLREKQFQLANE